MTGAYVRILRGGKWESIEIDQLSDAELEAFATLQPDAGWKWAKFLAKYIRDNFQGAEWPNA